jgi:ribosomal protein S27E
MSVTEAKTVAESLWRHIQCSECLKWFVVEDDTKTSYYCAHCGVLLKLPELKK